MNSRRTRQRSLSRAFTLIELIVVIGIIALVVGLSLPAISKLTKGNGEKQSVNLISAYLASARATAMNMRRPVAVIFYEDPNNKNQTAIALAQYDTSQTPPVMDGIPGRPSEFLPRGVKVATLDDQAASGQIGVGATGANANIVRPRMVLFDELGHVSMRAGLSAATYNNTRTYVAGQVVFYQIGQEGFTFTCKQTTTGNVPTIPPPTFPPDPNWDLTAWNLNRTTTLGGSIGDPLGFSSPGVLVYDDRALNDLLDSYGYNNGLGPFPAALIIPNVVTNWTEYISDWLQKHGDLLIVNAYTGTIIR